MKKLLLLIAIAMVAFVSASARWDVGTQLSASQIKPGDSLVLEYVASKLFASRFLTINESTNRGVLGTEGQLTEQHIWVAEEGPADARTGERTFYLRHLATGLYMVGDGGYSSAFSLTSNVDKAANWLIASCGEDLPFSNCVPFEGNGDHLKDGASGDKVVNWGVNGDGQGEVSGSSVGFIHSSDERSYGYLTCYFGTISKTGLQMCNQWNIFLADYTRDKISDLNDMIDEYSTFEPMGGDTPGYYSKESAEAFTDAMQRAVLMLVSGASDDEIDAMMAELKTARKNCEASVLPITAGYYYIVSGYNEFLNEQGVDKAVLPNTTTDLIEWKTLDTENGEFIWYIEPSETEDQFYVQHYFTSKYAGQINSWTGSSATTSMITTKTYPQRITGEVEGLFLWSDINYTYPTSSNGKSPFAGNGNGKTESGMLVAWGRTSDANDHKYIFEDHTNLWYIRPVSDEVMENFRPIKEQYDITKQLQELINTGSDLYSKLFSYTTDFSQGLIKRASGGMGEEPAADNQITFSGIRKQGIETADKYAFLIDGDSVTYMQGSGYISVKLDEPVNGVTFTYKTRGGTEQQQGWGMNERPKNVNIYMANTNEGDTVYTLVAKNVDMSEIAPHTVSFARPANRIAYEVVSNFTNGNYFTLSEFQVYEAVADESTSQYYTTEGLKDKADALHTMIADMQSVVAANTATKENVAALRTAIADVRELYADTTELGALIVEGQQLLEGVEVGDEMGQLANEELATNLQTAVAQGLAALEGVVTVAGVKAATDALKTATNAFLSGIKSFEVGKWYFIQNVDLSRAGAEGAEDAYCNGSVIYLNSKYPGSAVTKWGLFDETSMSLNADCNPAAMWTFVPMEGTSYYAIRNMYTGFYLGDYAGANINMPVSETPVPYEVKYSGKSQFTFYPRGGANDVNYALFAEGYEKDVVCHEAVLNSASSWTFIEAVPEDQEAITISDFAMNLIDVMAVPYDVSNLADFNEDVHTYGVRKMTQEEDPESGELITTVELYEKTSIKAGEPCIIVLGNTDEEVECEPYELVIPFPTEFVDRSAKVEANGLVGNFSSTHCDAGTAISTAKKFIPVTGSGTTFDAQTGVIDPATYKGEVKGVETALTLTISGLSKLPEGVAGDVNGDGAINAADVVSIYNYIISGEDSGVSAERADVNGDGTVNAADVVTVYNIIIDGSASSRKFRNRPAGI